MSNEQLHLTHRAEYLQGRKQGHRDAMNLQRYRPRDGAAGTEHSRQAYGLGYADGWAEALEAS